MESMTYLFIFCTFFRYARGEHEEKEETDPGDASASKRLLEMLQKRPLERPQGESLTESMTYLFIIFTALRYARGKQEEKEETDPGREMPLLLKDSWRCCRRGPLRDPQENQRDGIDDIYIYIFYIFGIRARKQQEKEETDPRKNLTREMPLLLKDSWGCCRRGPLRDPKENHRDGIDDISIYIFYIFQIRTRRT